MIGCKLLASQVSSDFQSQLALFKMTWITASDVVTSKAVMTTLLGTERDLCDEND